MTLGERIKEIRKSQTVSLRGLAKGADISVAYLSNIEKGESSPTVETLQRISGVLKVSVQELTEAVEGKSSFKLPPSLEAFVAAYQDRFPELSDPEWQRALAHVKLRGRYPEDSKDWLSIFASMRQAIGDDR